MAKNGFSLFEALLVLALAGILILAVPPSFHSAYPRYRLQRAVWEVQTCLNQARFKSIFDGTPVRVRFSSFGYFLEYYDETAKKWHTKERDFIEGVKLVANNSPVFYPAGTVSNLASILITNTWGTYKVTIAISGRIKAAKL